MLEHQILKILLNKYLYDKYRRKVNPSDGMLPWFKTLDGWFSSSGTSISLEELKELHLARHPAITNSAKLLIEQTFNLIKQAEVNPEFLGKLIEVKYNQERYAAFAEKFIKLSEGNEVLQLTEIEKELKDFSENRIKELEFAPKEITAEDMLDACDAQGKWKFNLPIWQQHIGGIGPGVFGLIAARPNAGKSLASISLSFAPNGWVEQGAKVVYLGNEEDIKRTKHRAICAWAGINYFDTTRTKRLEFIEKANEFNAKFVATGKVVFLHKTGLNYLKIEDLIQEHNPDIVIIDQLDKLLVPGDQEGHVRLRKLYTIMREFSVNYNISIIGVSQASDEATGKKYFGFEALEGSKTGKAAELDLCICIGAENIQQDNGARYFYVAKNKLTGWEGIGSYMINKEQSRMVS